VDNINNKVRIKCRKENLRPDLKFLGGEKTHKDIVLGIV